MIKRVFFDLDETLIHTTLSDPEQEHMVINCDYSDYYVIVRPSAFKIIKYARDLVGSDNVYILTAATNEYAQQINTQAGFGFRYDQIFTQEDIDDNRYNIAYGAYGYYSNKEISNPNNVLIDNLEFYYNTDKMSFIGIKSDRYLRIRDYYGNNNHEETFLQSVKEFLQSKIDND